MSLPRSPMLCQIALISGMSYFHPTMQRALKAHFIIISSINDMIYVTNVRLVFISSTHMLTLTLAHARRRWYVSRPDFGARHLINT